MSLELSEILNNRTNRKTRDARPFKNFIQTNDKLMACISFIDNQDYKDEGVKDIIANSIIVNQVTAIEVYCKDMLEAFFKICDPLFYKKRLKEIHKNKYDIDELIFMHERSIHPVELILLNQSFQNMEIINNFFSKLFKVNIFDQIKNLQVRMNSKSRIITFEDEEIFKQTKLLFETRHELVHNPSMKRISSDKIFKMLEESTSFIFGLDIILINNLNKNK